MARRISKNATYDINALSEAFNLQYDETERSLDNFRYFLAENKLSTVHAEEIYKLYNGESDSLSLKKNSFKIRKTHPKRDTFVKKVVIPTAVTSVAIGAAIGLIMASGLVGGSTVLGLIPVSGTPGLTAAATSIVGAATGLALTPSIIAIKGAITKAHYKTWYKSAKRNLKDYQSGVDIEALPIATLMERIENANHKILKTKTGAWYPFRSIRRHILNKINRNRIHHLEAYTKDLVRMFHTIERNNFQGKEEAIKPVYELLKQVDEFVSKNVRESKLHNLLTCKDSGNHTHKSTIENIDIFANLKTYVDAMSKAELKDVKATKAQVKKNVKNIANKKLKANELINEERLIAKLVARYEAENTLKAAPSNEENPIIEENPIVEEVAEENIDDIIDEITEDIIDEVTEDITEEVVEEEVIEEMPVEENLNNKQPIEENPPQQKEDIISFRKYNTIHLFFKDGKISSPGLLLSELERIMKLDKYRYEDSGRTVPTPSTSREYENFYADVLANDIEFKNQPDDVVKHYEEMARMTDEIHQLLTETKKTEEEAKREAEEEAKREAERLAREEAERLAEEKRKAEEEAKCKAEEKNNQPKNLVVKTAQRLSYETKPVSYNGDVIGTKLTVKTSDEKETVEIRYRASKKQIRVKTTGNDNAVSEAYVALTDREEIPPYTQINDILREVAKKKHISNVEDLIIEA